MMAEEFPPEMRYELEGWNLLWFRLLPTGEGIPDLERLREESASEARELYSGTPAGEIPVASAIRRLFRAAGTDPTRYRPSSEALLRRVLKGEPLPSIHPLVDLNNLLSLRLLVPCCVVESRSVSSPFTLRAGAAEESMESMRGPFNLESKPLLEDREGPFGTPITDSERVKIRPDTGEAWLVAYLPSEMEMEDRALAVMEELLEKAPVAELAQHSL
jgi:DNA/RNA-binding domain of Phe-tRNA-synthetase-like protein